MENVRADDDSQNNDHVHRRAHGNKEILWPRVLRLNGKNDSDNKDEPNQVVSSEELKPANRIEEFENEDRCGARRNICDHSCSESP